MPATHSCQHGSSSQGGHFQPFSSQTGTLPVRPVTGHTQTGVRDRNMPDLRYIQSLIPWGHVGNTHLAAFLHPTSQVSRTRSTDFPKSWNKNQMALLRQVVGLAKINHHGTIASNHIQNGTLPKGLIEPTGALLHAF